MRHLYLHICPFCGCEYEHKNWNHKFCSRKCFHRSRITIRQLNRREYLTWNAMRDRCRNPKDCRYAWYGGKGTKVCARWDTSFEAFLIDMGPRPLGRTIDRINNDGHYSCGKCGECLANGWPLNCRWATLEEQANNRSNLSLVTFNGVTKTITEWAKSLGLTRTAVADRLERGWSIEEAVTLPDSRYKGGRR
jgi:hypothetical protein